MTSEATDTPTTTSNLTTDFASNWTFPPAINNTFIKQWFDNMLQTNQTETDGQMILTAVKEEPLPSNWNFGSPDVELHVDDVIQPDWEGNDKRSVSLSCVSCSSGRTKGYTVGSGIFDACANYTDSSHVSQSSIVTSNLAPNSDFTLPSLSQTLVLPNATVGLCVMMLSNAEGGFTMDYSVPFPVLQEPRHPHYRFSYEDTSGFEDPSIPDSPAPSTIPTNVGGAKISSGGNGANKGLIAGVVVSVLMGVAFIALMGYWWLRRKKMQKKPARTSIVPLVPRGRNQNAPFTYRPTAEDEEVPPAYHEVVLENQAQGRASGNLTR